MIESNNEEREAELVAYLDGELTEADAREFEQKLHSDSAMRRDADALKRTWELLDFLPQPDPSATFTSRTLDKLSVLRPSPSEAVPAATATLKPIAIASTQTGAWKNLPAARLVQW